MAAPGGGMEGAEEAEGFVLGRLEQEALKRRERLKALRQRTLQVGPGWALRGRGEPPEGPAVGPRPRKGPGERPGGGGDWRRILRFSGYLGSSVLWVGQGLGVPESPT